MNPNEITGSRLKILRSHKGLSQQEFALQFSEFTNRKQPLSVMTISNWETGRKFPTIEAVIWIAHFYNVSADYILGLSNVSPCFDDSTDDIINDSFISSQFDIPYSDLGKYDGKPVFVSFPLGNYTPQWALVDFAKKTLICKDIKLSLSPSFKYSTITPPELVTVQSLAHHYLGFEDVLKLDHVYVESLSPDPFLRGQVNGWYHHTPDRTCLINDKGNVLSYEGIDVAYRVISY